MIDLEFKVPVDTLGKRGVKRKKFLGLMTT